MGSADGYEGVRERLRAGLGQILGNEAAEAVLAGTPDPLRSLEARLALVSFDVDGIKEFVFASPKPLEIQGASAMVKDLDESGSVLQEVLEKHGLSPDAVVFAGGGSGLAVVPADRAEAFCRELRRQFNLATGVGTCSVVWRAFHPRELIGGPDGRSPASGLPPGVGPASAPTGFGAVLRLMADLLREAKEERLEPLLPPLPGYLRRCESCGREAAAYEDSVRPPWARDRVCGSCLAKRHRGRQERGGLPAELQTALTIEDVTGKEEGSYYAVVYADANGLGETLFGLPNLVDCAVFSRSVTRLIGEYVRHLVKTHGLTGRYQAPVVGGDDLLLVVPAGKAASVVRDILEGLGGRFRQEGEQVGGPAGQALAGVSFSVGFVVVPAHFPVRFAVDYAEELLKSAKKARYAYARGPTGPDEFVDWMVIKDASPLNLSVEDLREEAFFRRTGPDLRLTAKPMPGRSFIGLLEDVDRLRKAGVSRAQLHELEQTLLTEPPRAVPLHLGYRTARLEGWQNFLKSRPAGEAANPLQAWLADGVFVSVRQPGRGFYQTNLLDLMELYEFSG
jgi:hypothetical protein